MSAKIYRGMTRTTLDAEYDNRAKVLDFTKYLEEWAALSRTACSELRVDFDVPYDPDSGRKLDIVLPVKDSPQTGAVQIFFHGGYWIALDKSPFTFVARAFAGYGVTTVIVDYSLIPEVTMSEIVRQCRESVVWLYENRKALGIDADRLFVSGHSAGGHLAALTAATNWREYGYSSQLVRAGVGISGLYDLEPISKCFLQDSLNLSETESRQHSPVHLRPSSNVRFLPLVGALEGPEYLRQSETLFESWGGDVCDQPEVLDLDNHFTIISSLAEQSSKVARLMRGLMNL